MGRKFTEALMSHRTTGLQQAPEPNLDRKRERTAQQGKEPFVRLQVKERTVAFHRWSAKEKLLFNNVGGALPLDKRASTSTSCEGKISFALLLSVCALSVRMGPGMVAHLPLSPKLAKEEPTMTQVNIHTAKTQLSKLIEAALVGEDVVIAKGSQPVVRLVPIPQGRFKLGIMAGTLGNIPDFLEPQDEGDLDAWEGAPA